MNYFINTNEILSPKFESIYYNFTFFSPMGCNNDIEDDNNSSYEEKQNKENNFESIFKNEFDSERFNIEKSNAIETQIKENKNPKNDELINPKLELSLLNTKCSSKKVTMLNNKRKRNNAEKDEIKKEKVEKEKENYETEKEIEERRKYYEKYYIKEAKQKGRKKKGESAESNHTKHSEDNMIRKIKSFFMHFIHDIVNKSFKNKNYQFLKLDSKISENLKKDFNLKLLDTKLKDLYEKSDISTKYRRQIKDSSDKNKFLIKIIYEENKEIETIKLLNLTLRELFNIFRRKIKNIDDLQLEMKINNIPLLSNELDDVEKFFDEIKAQEIDKNEKNEDINEYLGKIEKLCKYYEEWFLIKKGRNRQ